MPNCRKINQHFPLQGPPKYPEIGIFGLKTNHLATLIRFRNQRPSETNPDVRTGRWWPRRKCCRRCETRRSCPRGTRLRPLWKRGSRRGKNFETLWNVFFNRMARVRCYDHIFLGFSAKNGVFFKKMLWSIFCRIQQCFESKTSIFRRFFWRKYF
jgi:hypothetical protein